MNYPFNSVAVATMAELNPTPAALSLIHAELEPTLTETFPNLIPLYYSGAMTPTHYWLWVYINTQVQESSKTRRPSLDFNNLSKILEI